MEPERILVIRTGGLGDSLLLWPGLSGMRRRFARSEIDLMGHKERLEPLLVPGGINHALEIEGSGLHRLFQFDVELPSELRQRFGRYNIVVAFATPGEYALAENLSVCGVSEVHAFLPFPHNNEPIHAADHIKRALINVELATVDTDPLLPVTEVEQAKGIAALNAISASSGPLALLAPGSGSKYKCWDPENHAKLAIWFSHNGIQPIFIEGPADTRSVSSAMQHLSNHNAKILKGISPSVLKGIMHRASLYVGNDSGTTHLSAMIGARTIAVFGPTDPNRWSPRGPGVKILRNTEACSPCSSDEMRACQDRKCLRKTSVEQAISLASEMLSQSLS